MDGAGSGEEGRKKMECFLYSLCSTSFPVTFYLKKKKKKTNNSMTVTEILNVTGHIGHSSIESRRKIHIGGDRDRALKIPIFCKVEVNHRHSRQRNK